MTKLPRNFIIFHHQAYHAAVWDSRQNMLGQYACLAHETIIDFY